MWVQICTVEPGLSGCPDPSWVRFSELTAFSVAQLDTGTLMAAFSSGFLIVGTCFVIGRSVRLVLHMIGR